MKRWSEFVAEKPNIAQAGQALIAQFCVACGSLVTVRKDGGPRVHPVRPVIAHDSLYVFIGNHSPKVQDLRRDDRFALHAKYGPRPSWLPMYTKWLSAADVVMWFGGRSWEGAADRKRRQGVTRYQFLAQHL